MTEVPMKLSAGLYTPGDEEQILALNRLEYGPTNVMVNPEDFHWRYAENPAGQTQVTVVRDEAVGRIVGFTWTIPLRMRLFRKDYLGVLTANLLIHPDYRNTMAYVKLISHRARMLRAEQVPFRYNFPVESLFARAGSAEGMSSFLIPLLIYPLDMQALVRTRVSARWAQVLLGAGGHLVAPLFFRRQGKGAEEASDHLQLVWIEKFDARFDDLWQRVQDKYAMMAVRNAAYLSWRFAPVSRRTYRTVVALDGDTLVGYAVVRCTDEIRGIPIGLIMDLLLEPGPRGERAGSLLLEEVGRYFKKEDVAMAGGLMLPHTDEYQVLLRAGYRPTPPRLTPRLFRVAFNCYDAELPPTDQIKPEDWFLTIADYEAH